MTDHPHSKIIDEIGFAHLRRELDLPAARLWNWRRRGIPAAFLLKVHHVATTAGVAVPTDFLAPILPEGMPPPTPPPAPAPA